jgi:hypothetical protein
MAWITPIYDRTQADVTNKTAKGKLNDTDLNRIETDIEDLKVRVLAYGYDNGISDIESKSWDDEDIAFKTELDRIRDNLNLLKEQYHNYSGSPVVTNTNYLNWEKVNDIEKNLQLLNKALTDMATVFRYSGTDYSGEV